MTYEDSLGGFDHPNSFLDKVFNKVKEMHIDKLAEAVVNPIPLPSKHLIL